MKQFLLSGLMGLMLLPVPAALAQTFQVPPGITNFTVAPGATNFFSNNGFSISPQIDAVTFINSGIFEASSLFPFETSDTLYYTNTGSMFGAVGWRFDNSPSSAGVREPSAIFFNGNNGIVQAIDTGTIIVVGSLNSGVVTPSYLVMGATNIINQGVLNVGANGLLQLSGNNVDLSSSISFVTSVPDEAMGTFQPIFTNYFIPDIAVYDLYWGTTNIDAANPLNTVSIWNGFIATAPPEFAVLPNPAPGFSIAPSKSDSYINASGGTVTLTNMDLSSYDVFLNTNVIKGAVFVACPSDMNLQLGFTLAVSNFDDIGVLMSLPVSDPVTGTSSSSFISFRDLLAGEPGKGLLINAVNFNTERPTNYIVDRLNRFPGAPGNHGPPEPAFFLTSGNLGSGLPGATNITLDVISNAVVQNGSWSAYSAYFDDVVSRPAAVVGGTITNLPGSLWINSSGNLNLDGARLGAVGQAYITGTHLVSSTNAVIDCQNLSFNLGSTNGILEFRDLAKTATEGHITGSLVAWSAVWSNTVTLVITNNWMTNTTGSGSTNAPYTNAIGVSYHCLILDASSLQTTLPVYVYNLALHGTDITVEDQMNVLQTLLIDGKSFTLNGGITVPGVFPPANPINNTTFQAVPLDSWKSNNAPNLLYFTNHGSLSINNEAHFGDDRPPYATFINAGSLSAGGVNISSSYFENDGTLSAAFGALTVQCGTGKLQNGSSSSGNFSQFIANSLKFNNFTLSSGDALSFNVANSLFDAGPASGNVFVVNNGFNLLTKPQTGDLLGTSLQTVDPTITGRRINHSWAGENRGATPAGYVDDEAIGKLTFATQSTNTIFRFSGTGGNNGLYVDFLDLRALGSNYVKQLRIDPGLVIYYAAATNSYTPPLSNGISQQWEEYLNGQFNGRLRWVSAYAGPNSSTSVIVVTNGKPVSISVNTALANSQIIDSDGDGRANNAPGYPVGAPPFAVATLTLQTNGVGAILPNYGGQLLLVGQTYDLTARPADGFAFSGWTGSITSASPQFSFVMTNGLSFTASFISVLTPGSYRGLFYEPQPNGVEILKSGAITVTTSANRKFSGTLQTANKHYSFSGQLNTNNAASFNIPGSPLVVSLQVGNNQISGTVGDGSTWTANIVGNSVTFSSSNKAPFAGKFTVILPGTGNPGDTNNPQGDSYGTVTVSPTGGINFSGSLADGTKVSQATSVVGDSQWPLFIPLYGGLGQILGWLTFANNPDQDLSGQASWIKVANAKAKIYPAGFDFSTAATGSGYNSSLVPVTVFSNGVVVLSGGNLATDAGGLISVDSKNKVTGSANNKLKVTLNPSQGSFSGSVLNSAGKAVKFNGVILQKQGFGAGYFLGTNQSGTVFFGPP